MCFLTTRRVQMNRRKRGFFLPLDYVFFYFIIFIIFIPFQLIIRVAVVDSLVCYFSYMLFLLLFPGCQTENGRSCCLLTLLFIEVKFYFDDLPLLIVAVQILLYHHEHILPCLFIFCALFWEKCFWFCVSNLLSNPVNQNVQLSICADSSQILHEYARITILSIYLDCLMAYMRVYTQHSYYTNIFTNIYKYQSWIPRLFLVRCVCLYWIYFCLNS